MKTRLPKPQDRLVLITGGSSGLGLALAQQMIQEGSQVIICGRDPLKLKAAQEGCPELVTYSCDITVPAQRAALAEWVKDHHPGVNVLINNAGIVRRYLFAQSQSLAEDLEAEFQTNLFAPLLLTQDLLPLLRRNLGAIVNVSSGLAYVPLHIQPSYCATKAALHSMTQSLRIQLRAPGAIGGGSPLSGGADPLPRRPGTPGGHGAHRSRVPGPQRLKPRQISDPRGQGGVALPAEPPDAPAGSQTSLRNGAQGSEFPGGLRMSGIVITTGRTVCKSLSLSVI
jgi:short-subunit dehydrogenase involved in D-alanine esterification of teichoic acids